MKRKELEYAVIGTILSDFFIGETGKFQEDSFNWAVSRLKSEDFLTDDCRKIFADVLRLHAEGKSREEIILEVKRKYEDTYEFLVEYALVSFTTFLSYAKKLLEESVEYQRIKVGEKLAKGEVDENKATAILVQLKKRLEDTDKTPTDAIHDVLTSLEEGRYEGISTGFPKLDFYVSLRPEEVTIIGARPSVGKTATAVVMAYSQLLEGKRILFFSMELPAKEILLRMLAFKTDWSLRDIKSGRVPFDAVLAESEELSSLPLVIYDNPNLTVPVLRAKIHQHNPDIVYIDYIQRIVNHDPKTYRTRLEFLNYVSIELTNIAKEYRIPIVTLAQLNRGVRAGKDQPTMEHLKDTGHLEQDATNIILLHRDFKESPNTMKFIIAKCREGAGPSDSISVDFINGFPQPHEKKEPQPVPVATEQPQEEEVDELFDF